MRFADGAKGPGYNAQFRTASKIGVIVEVQVIRRHNDSNMLTPMLDSFEFRYGYSPARILGDGSYCVKEDIEKVLRRGMEVYCPKTKSRESSTVREV
jgi:hypothetical protein